ncbi:hypothetical protein B0H19DRAFT_1257602 [Mycena capillaripes]|nr:hypothetical protein B0H19DRAFT_1257602 [Mycena capillaripes]
MQDSTEFASDHTSEGSGPGFSGMFSGAQHGAVTGHTLINTTNYYTTAATVPSDVNVKMVSLWDIDLQHEIHLNNSTGVVDRQRIQPSVRRMYSAKIAGQSTTVAMYQGRDAEEEWRQDLAKYSSIRQVWYFWRFVEQQVLAVFTPPSSTMVNYSPIQISFHGT